VGRANGSTVAYITCPKASRKKPAVQELLKNYKLFATADVKRQGYHLVMIKESRREDMSVGKGLSSLDVNG
jgi:hypothetical protein